MKTDICADAVQWAKVICPALIWLICRRLLRIWGEASWAEIAGTGLLLVSFGIFRLRTYRSKSVPRKKAVRTVLMYGMIGLVAGGLIRLIPGEDSFSSRTAANVALLCVLGPVSEEIVYRGLVFDAAEKMKGFVFALVISTLLFACGHRMLLQMAISVPVGLALGMIREKEGNLLAPIAFHSMLNVAALILSARMGS